MPDAAESTSPGSHPGPTRPEPAGPPAAPPADLSGRTLGEFHIIRRIGAGGMGQVYLARQLSLKRQVALKLLRNDLAANPTALKRFQAEAEAVARLNHPNVVQVYGAGESDGLRYMALEYVDGRNLRDYLARKGPPELPVALSIMRQVAAALQKAHDQGLVHRDIKPENILVTRKVEVKVTDFGLSRFFTGAEALNLTQSGVTLGTPLYLSPEQAQGHTLDHRSDLYSFGVTCYHLLAGEPPFRGTTAVEVALKHVTDQPRPLAELRPDLPPDLCGLVHKLMAKNPVDRYQSAREVLRDLAKVREGLSLGLAAAPPALSLSLSALGQPSTVGNSGVTMAVGTSGVVPAVPPARLGRWVLAGCLVGLAAAAGVAAAVYFHPAPEPPPTPPPPPPVPGLPDVRPVEKPTTTRERELLAILATEEPKSEDWTAASIELGLLYVKERRLAEAEARFRKLEAKVFPREAVATWAANLAGRLGQAVVTAYRDGDPQHPPAQVARDSLKQFTEAVNAPLAKLPGAKFADRAQAVQMVLLRHPELAQAVAEALNRDAVNAGQARIAPPVLEALRTPRGLTRKE